MKTLIGYIIILFLVSCDSLPKSTKESKEKTSEILKSNRSKKGEIDTMIMTNSSLIEPSEKIMLFGCKFSIVKNTHGDTTYWTTNDANFRVPEGYNIGTKWCHLPNKLTNSVERMPGWGYHIKLGSGWQLGFCEGKSCTKTKPSNESTVKWIFKRR